MNVTKYSLKGYEDKYTEVWGVESTSNPEKVYTVALNKQGCWSCGCPRWTMNRMRLDCKHIKHIKYIRERQTKSAPVKEAPMTEQVRKKLSTFAFIEL